MLHMVWDELLHPIYVDGLLHQICSGMPVYSTSMLPTSAPMSHTVWDELLHPICVDKLLHLICVDEYLHPIPIRSNVPVHLASMLPTSASMLHTVWGELLHPIISYRSLAEEFHRYFQLIYIYFLISPSQKTFILSFRPSTLKFLQSSLGNKNTIQ